MGPACCSYVPCTLSKLNYKTDHRDNLLAAKRCKLFVIYLYGISLVNIAKQIEREIWLYQEYDYSNL